MTIYLVRATDGGSKVKIVVCGITPVTHFRQRIPVEVTIDGNVLVKVFTVRGRRWRVLR